jgi:phosphatidylglycerophosphatase A
MSLTKHQAPSTKHLSWGIATWFGCGLSPVASGTVGSLAALPFAYVLFAIAGSAGLALAAAALFVLGVWASQHFLKAYGGEDPKEIVVDEVAAQWLVLAFVPQTLMGYALGFLLFRVFDVLKPWPVSWADQQVKGAFGVMLDDALAALYAILVFMGIVYVFPQLA